MTKYDGWEGRGGGGFTNIMYHEIAENILNKKVMEVARQAQKKRAKKQWYTFLAFSEIRIVKSY